jgi:hypothetical protein
VYISLKKNFKHGAMFYIYIYTLTDSPVALIVIFKHPSPHQRHFLRFQKEHLCTILHRHELTQNVPYPNIWMNDFQIVDILVNL